MQNHTEPFSSGSSARTLFTMLTICLLTTATASAQPQINSLSSTTLDRSGRLIIAGSGFGASQGSSQVLIGGLDAIETQWTDTEIHTYVPEQTALGSVPVQVVTSSGSSNSSTCSVTLRQPNGRVQWSFQTDNYRPLQFVARGPDGTVYVSDWVGLYALSRGGRQHRRRLEWGRCRVNGEPPDGRLTRVVIGVSEGIVRLGTIK